MSKVTEETPEATTGSELDPEASEYVPLDDRDVHRITRAMATLVGENEEKRAEDDERRLGTVMDAVEEREKQALEREKKRNQAFEARESTLTSLLEEIIRSNRDTTEQARIAEEKRMQLSEKQEREAARRWKEEKVEKARKEALKAIPPPPPMTKDQDVADYLDLFQDNMKSREIPKLAKAKHLLPLLNTKATIAVSGLPPEDKANIDTLMETLLSIAYETTKYASKAYWQHAKQGGDSARTTMTKLLRLGRRFALAESPEKTLKRLTMEKFYSSIPLMCKRIAEKRSLRMHLRLQTWWPST